MPTTTNKLYSVQTAGSNPGVWGAGSSEALNEGVIELLDLDLGGLQSTALSSSPVTLTPTQGRSLVQRFTGVLLANVTVTSPNIGFNIYENTTTGNFTVTVQFTGGVGGSVVLPRGGAALIVADATNGLRDAKSIFPKVLAASGDLTPSTITANQNNYAPTGHAEAFRFRLASDAVRTITGLAGGTPGRIVVLANIGSNGIQIANEDAASTAANRFLIGTQGPLFISADEAAAFHYDVASLRWRPWHNADMESPSFTNATLAGFVDIVESAAPANPSANTGRLSAVDESTVTNLAWRDSGGVVSGLRRASEAEMEGAASLLRTVPPGLQNRHPGHPKAGGNFDGSGTPAFRAGDYGMGAITDIGTGHYTLALDTAFENTNYWVNSYARSTITNGVAIASSYSNDAKTASTFPVAVNNDGGDPVDSTEIGITFWGNYA